LILAGADSNTSSNGTVRRAGTYRLLSLYKPLVLAAKRKGAPLCRNRIWTDGRNLIVRRSASLLDTIFSSTTLDTLGLVYTFHGGKRVDVSTSGGINPRSVLFTNNQWTSQAQVSRVGYSLSGSAESYSEQNSGLPVFGHSHDGDSIATFAWLTGPDPFSGGQVQIIVHDSARGGPNHNLGVVSSQGPQVNAIAYSPIGDAIFVATGATRGTVQPNPTIKYWRVPMSGAAPTLIWETPANWWSSSLAVSEDGTELITDIERESGGLFFLDDCWTEYRSSITGVRLDSVAGVGAISSDHDCAGDRHGAASARRVSFAPSVNRVNQPSSNQWASVGHSLFESLFH
jgi:hypothetical protein